MWVLDKACEARCLESEMALMSSELPSVIVPEPAGARRERKTQSLELTKKAAFGLDNTKSSALPDLSHLFDTVISPLIS